MMLLIVTPVEHLMLNVTFSSESKQKAQSN